MNLSTRFEAWDETTGETGVAWRDEEGHVPQRPFAARAKRIYEVAQAVPRGVICLTTALEVYGCMPSSTDTVWVAIANKARRPSKLPSFARVVWLSNESLEAGKRTLILKDNRATTKIAVHVPAKSIVDCFKFRRQLSEYSGQQLPDLVALLQHIVGAYRRNNYISVRAIRKYLEVCRMTNVMGPYLDALERTREPI